MQGMNGEQFKRSQFAVRVFAKGEILDEGPYSCGAAYIIQTTTIQLNRTAMNEWLGIRRLCSDEQESDQIWKMWHPGEDREGVRQRIQKLRTAFNNKIFALLGISTSDSKMVYIKEVVSEIFIVVRIRAIPDYKQVKG